MAYLNYNGKMVPDDTPIVTAQNRGLRYGDGLFETMKLTAAGIELSDDHFARLWKGMQLFEFDIPKLWSPEMLEGEAQKTAAKNKLSSARIRLTVIRGSGGLYENLSQAPQYIIETIALPSAHDQLNSNGLELCIYRDAVKVHDRFSGLKHNNFLPYLSGAAYAKKQQCNDAVILNPAGRICETTLANIFIIKDGIIKTPELSEGCIAGVMRKNLLQRMPELGYAIEESTITEQELLEADEVFTTNSIYKIRWVQALENQRYSNNMISKIYENLRG